MMSCWYEYEQLRITLAVFALQLTILTFEQESLS